MLVNDSPFLSFYLYLSPSLFLSLSISFFLSFILCHITKLVTCIFGVNIQNDKITFKFIVADSKYLEMKGNSFSTYKRFEHTSATKEDYDVETWVKEDV